jgi:hypothetical protein
MYITGKKVSELNQVAMKNKASAMGMRSTRQEIIADFF